MKPLIVFTYRRGRAYACHVLTGALEEAGLDGRLEIRYATDRNQLAGLLDENRPTLVGWTFFSSEFPEIRGDLEWIRNHNDRTDILHLAGGVHATALPSDTLNAGFDRVAVGEGEASLVDFATKWLDGGDLDTVRGIGRLENGRYLSAGPADVVDLDRWPAVAARTGRFNPIEITRGCVYGCRFCQAPFVAKARFRHRSVESVEETVRVMLARGMWDYRFITPSAFSYGSDDEHPRLDRVEALLDAIRRLTGPRGRIFFGSFPAEARPEHVTPEAIALLKRYVNNDNLVIGAQSGSDRLLKACHRGHTVDDVERATRLSVEAGFKTYVDLIFGLPGETPDDVELTKALAERLAGWGAKLHAHSFLPLPGTPFAGEQSGAMAPETELFIERLASKGGLFGQWRGQSALAGRLAGLKKEKRRRNVSATTGDR